MNLQISSETDQRQDQEHLDQVAKEKKEKRDHHKFLIKIMLNGLGLSSAEKRALLIEVMQDLGLTHVKVIEEIRR